VNHGAQQNVDLLLLPKHQFAVVATDALYGVAAIDGTAAFAELASLLLGSIGAEHDVFRSNPDGLQEAHPELVSSPDVQHLRNTDAHLRAISR
jgi:hypothetical protein